MKNGDKNCTKKRGDGKERQGKGDKKRTKTQ